MTLADDMVTINPLAIFGWMGVFLLGVLVFGWALSKIMPPADYPDRPWPTPPRFPPGKVGEFMAEEELRRRIARQKAARPDQCAAAWADGETQEHQRKAEG